MASRVGSLSASRDMDVNGAASTGSGVILIPGVRSEFSWKSRSFASPQTPAHQQPSQEELKLHRSVLTIEDWWIRMKNRKVFRVLKEAVCAAEHSLTQEVLRKVSPSEAELLKDPAIKAKVKFRFGGDMFPPVILFKVFTSTSSIRGVAGGGVQYISGRRLIKPASEAAEDSRRQMGNRKFYNQLLLDACHHQQLKVTDEVDVTTMKEYMQYAANLDESPAYLGGKENTWRKLNLDALPRHSFLHNLVEFLERDQLLSSNCNRTTASIERLQSLTRPPTQYEQIEHIKTVSSLRSLSSHRAHSSRLHKESGETLRRSRQAQQRVDQMRKAYGLGTTTPLPVTAEARSPLAKHDHEQRPETGARVDKDALESNIEEVDEMEKEAFDLYQWSQELSFEDIG